MKARRIVSGMDLQAGNPPAAHPRIVDLRGHGAFRGRRTARPDRLRLACMA